MAITQEQLDSHRELQEEKKELERELVRIDDFFARDSDNADNGRAINAGKIFTKFAGTAAHIPVGVFIGALNARKVEITKRLDDIEDELSAL